LTNFSVIRSLSPIAEYFSRSTSPSKSSGGSVHTPFGWSRVSVGFALISERATSLNPAASTRSITHVSGR